MTERTREELVERLEWLLAYFNDETDKYLSPHPDFIKNIEGFDETAIEPDLRAAAQRLEEMPDGERIEVWAQADDLDVSDVPMAERDYIQVWWEKPVTIETVPAILTLHPQEPTAQKRTARPVSSGEVEK